MTWTIPLDHKQAEGGGGEVRRTEERSVGQIGIPKLPLSPPSFLFVSPPSDCLRSQQQTHTHTRRRGESDSELICGIGRSKQLGKRGEEMQRRLLVSFFHANNRGELVFTAPKRRTRNKKTPYKCRNVVQFSDTYCALDHKPCMQFRQEQRAHLITDSYARLATDFSRSGSRLSRHHRYYGTPRPLFLPRRRDTRCYALHGM